MMNNTIRTLLKEGTEALKSCGIPSEKLDAELLLSGCTGFDRIVMYTDGDRPVSEEQAACYRAWIKRRCDFEPVAYILGVKEFMGLPFSVSPAVLIPRPDTECLVEYLLEAVIPKMDLQGRAPEILDLCTGSGAIGLSLAHYLKNSRIWLSDISDAALEMAKKNAADLSVTVEGFYLSDLFEKIDRSFDLIVSNPPYIPDRVIEGLQRDIQEYEPRLALSGGTSGLDIYERIARTAAEHLKDRGYLMLEIGDGQEVDLVPMLEAQGFRSVALIPDLSGTIRGVFVQKRSVHNS